MLHSFGRDRRCLAGSLARCEKLFLVQWFTADWFTMGELLPIFQTCGGFSMCEFCLEHGEGRKWYLEAKNYGLDLASDINRQQAFQKFAKRMTAADGDFHQQMEKLENAPAFVRRLIRWKTVRSMKKFHYGQIVPIEDVERIFEFVNQIIRTSCLCRKALTGEEKRYCYGVSMGPGGGNLEEAFKEIAPGFTGSPDPKGNEVVTKEEALASFRELEKEGLCHSVWTFVTPFIGGICNCDRPDCLAMQMTVIHGTPVMFRAEYVAETNLDTCDGCRLCMRVCQFGAIGYSAGQKKSHIDPRRCYGCGICRSVCKKNAIHLKDRAQVPAAANMW
jgi:ferredoxin